MADLDTELVKRVARWCAEAGRTSGAEEIRAALGGLGWDELLTARALLADPPPARPLGPYALADLARGVPPDLAAERERTSRYPQGPAPAAPQAPHRATGPTAAKPRPARTGARTSRRATVLVRKPAPPPAPPPPAPGLPFLDELFLPQGRIELARLLRKHGAARPRLLTALAEAHRRPDGMPIADADLDRLLTHHGQARAFLRRERDALLHALRAAGGVRARAAAALGYAPEALDGALARAGATAEAEKLRDAKRRELRTRGSTLSEKVRLVVADPERLEDLGLLADFEADLKVRLPEHLKALARGGEPLALALAGSVSMPVGPVHDLATRLGLSLGGAGGRGALPGSRPLPSAGRGGDRERPPRGDRPPRTDRPGGGRPGGDRTHSARPSVGRPPGDRPGGGRPFGDRPGAGRTAGERPAGRPGGFAPRGPRLAGDRPTSRPSTPAGRPAGRPAGAGRPPFASRPTSAGRPPGGTRPAGPGAAGRGRPPSRGPRTGQSTRPPGRGPKPGGRGPPR